MNSSAGALPRPQEPPAARAPGRRGATFEAVALPLLLSIGTFIAFFPVLSNHFVAWDDASNLARNPGYRGLGWTQLRWMLTTVLLGHYIPLTWFSFGLDYVLWGMNPFGYHLTSLLLHIVAVLLFYAVSRDLLRKAGAGSELAATLGAATAALFFGIHPLRVESVAWATERRDVLSGVWFLLTILLYLRAVETSGRRRRRLLALSVAAYLLALLSKAIVMTLPVVLILLDVYPLRRLAATREDGRWRPRLWEKAPYLALSVAGAVMAYLAQAVLEGPKTPYASSPWPSRAANIAYSLWFYAVKTFVPAGLSPLYEAPPHIDPFEARFAVGALGVAGLSLVVVLLRSKWPGGLTQWLYYGVVLAPVSGVVPMGSQLVGDRYSYLPCLGWALLVGAGAGALVDSARRGIVRSSVAGLAGVVGLAAMLGLGVLTWEQAKIWHDTETLWRHAVSVTPDCLLCRKFLGETLLERGAALSALEQFLLAVEHRPAAVGLRLNVGVAYARLGMWPQAIEQYRRVLDRYPDRPEVRHALAVALYATGRPADAIEQLRAAMGLRQDDPDVRTTLGLILNDLGEPAEAAAHLQRAVALRPRSPIAHLGLIRAYAALGQSELTRREYEALRALDPRLAATVDGRGLVSR